ncbi:hypothetical protein JGU66_24845 [Myxococcaceae bacterium JPH2]|nr:hypothetical protein [Myxococcaceae bacterium JPH2]
MKSMTWLRMAAVGLLVLSGCSEDKDGGGGGGAGDKAGFGDDRGRPVGAAWSLPTGLRLDGDLTGTDDDGYCGPVQLDPVGSGFMVRACLPVRNDGVVGIPLDLPAGLILVASSPDYQHGVLLEDSHVVIYPGGADAGPEVKGGPLPIHAFCLNHSRSASEPKARYTLGPITQNAQVKELISLIKGKNVAEDGSKVEVVQEALWHITDGSGLTADDRAALAEL